MSNHKEITRIPRVLSNIPFDPTNKKDYFTVEEKRELDDIDNFSLDGTIDKLISSNSNELIMKLEKRTYLRIEEGKQTQDLITQIAFLKAAKALNNLDLKIIFHSKSFLKVYYFLSRLSPSQYFQTSFLNCADPRELKVSNFPCPICYPLFLELLHYF